MKLLRYLLAIVMVCALSGIAKATTLNFHMVVVDAGTPLTTIYLTPPPSAVSFSFGACNPSVGPAYEGCAYFVNDLGYALTSLDLVLPDSGAAAGLTPDCTPYVGGLTNFFADSSCTVSGDDYLLDFYDGSIPNSTAFIIAENGVSTCPPWTGTLTTTPEPASIWLLSTGALLLGVFFYYKRRNDFGEMRL